MGNDSAHWSLSLCLQFSPPEPLTPDSPQVSLVLSALPLPEPRVHSYKQNFVLWPFKRLSASPAISPWQRETLRLFTAGCCLGSFMALVLLAGQPSLGFRPHTSQAEPLSCWNIPQALQLLPVGAQSALLCLLCTPYQPCCGEVVSSVSPWLSGFFPASVQLVIQDDFSTI